MIRCGFRGCTERLWPDIDPDSGYCMVHGTRNLVAPLPLPNAAYETKCPDCGEGVSREANRCRKCAGLIVGAKFKGDQRFNTRGSRPSIQLTPSQRHIVTPMKGGGA